MPFFGLLFIILILVLATATFIESGYGTATAWAVVYGTRWFEVLLFLIAVNLAGNLVRNRFFLPGRLAVLVFHVAFLLILAGAAITRFISTEGTMRIREGSATDLMIGSSTLVDISATTGGDTVYYSRAVRLSKLTPRAFRASLRPGGEKLTVRSVGVISNAVEKYTAFPGGDPLMQLILVAGRQYQLAVPGGEARSVPGLTVSLNAPSVPAQLKVFSSGEDLYALCDAELSVMTMGGGESTLYQAGDTIPFLPGKLMQTGNIRFVLQKFLPSARREFVEAEDMDQGSYPDVIRFELGYRGMKASLYAQGMPGMLGQVSSVRIGDLDVNLSYGARMEKLPFALMLRDFEVTRYPGSNSPSSFASEVTLIDQEKGITDNRRIFMNNVLKHRGYRFYQSSYDNDEKGTVLSVNKDFLGTFVTYAGYFFLMLGMFLALFSRGTRFAGLVRLTSKKPAAVVALLLLLGLPAMLNAQHPVPPAKQSAEFGKLWVQGKEGRFKPVNTLSGEMLRKIAKHSTFESYSADQVILGMALYPDEWRQAALFSVDNPQLQQMLGYKGESVSFNDFFDMTGDGGYLLSDLVNQAYSKKVSDRNDLDKEIIKLDEQINVMYMVQTGELWRLFPDPAGENNTWLSVSDLMEKSRGGEEHASAALFFNLLHALQEGNYASADSAIAAIGQMQQSASDIFPSDTHRKAEILYNKLNIFERLAIVYGLMGFILLVLQFVITFKPGTALKKIYRGGVIILSLTFVVHLAAFLLRWYISGHAPLSNGYESMIFVSLVSLLAGLVFERRSGFAIGLTAILAANALLVAHMSWMNPDITNLVPVLKSTWLTIHVTVVMAGYGFLGLGALLGMTGLIFYALVNEQNVAGLKEVIARLTKVNQLTMIVGLYFMTAGVFLGGVWANESWGRYWGWDPKETWALITVLAYAFVVHLNNIPGLKGSFPQNLGSFAAYTTVLMTYFGVNYFLKGLHSYAGGTSFRIPVMVYVVFVLFVILALVAYKKWKQYIRD